MTDEFVWLRTGEKCRVIYRDSSVVFAATRIVYDVPYGDDCETVEEDGRILHLSPGQVHDAPPTRVLSEEVKELESKIVALKDELRDRQRAAREAGQAHEEKMKEYARLSSALARLDEFLDSGITHYLVLEKYYKPKILTVKETFSENHWKKGEGRLLTLRPKKARTLTWSLNQYRDGSGMERECVPCTSYGEALTAGQKWIDEQAANEHYLRRVIEFAREYGLSLPEGYVAVLIEREREGLELRQLRAEKERELEYDNKVAEWEELRSESKDLPRS